MMDCSGETDRVFQLSASQLDTRLKLKLYDTSDREEVGGERAQQRKATKLITNFGKQNYLINLKGIGQRNQNSEHLQELFNLYNLP